MRNHSDNKARKNGINTPPAIANSTVIYQKGKKIEFVLEMLSSRRGLKCSFALQIPVAKSPFNR